MTKFESKGGEKMENKNNHVPADEIWFRQEDQDLLKQKKVFTTVRLGNRGNGTCENKGCYFPGNFVTLKVLADKEKQQFSDWQTDIVIIDAELMKFIELDDEDLHKSLPNQQNKKDLRQKLAEFYGREIADNELITLIDFEYKENLKAVADLVKYGILKIAKEPQSNPANFSYAHYTVPLIEHDYPAKTPVMWNMAYYEFNIPAGNIMLVGDPSQSKHILDVFRQDKKFQGGGAGVGFKDEAIKYLDELDPMAQAIGSINFILKTTEGKLKGYNTDGLGYALSLEDKFKSKGEKLRDKKVVILGAGGTGNAIAFALADKGTQIIILNRTVTKAEELAKRINQYFQFTDDKQVKFGGEELIESEVQSADVIINVSTKGAAGELQDYSSLAPARLPATPENIELNLTQAEKVLSTISKKSIISDIVLTKQATPLLASAQKARFETLDGIPMVVNQGVEAFWLLYEKKLQEKGITKEQVAQVMTNAAGLK